MNNEIEFYDKLADAKPGDHLQTPTGRLVKVARQDRELSFKCEGCALKKAMTAVPGSAEAAEPMQMYGIDCFDIPCRAWERSDGESIILTTL